MSTGYDLHCLDCKTSTPFDWNHANEELFALLEKRAIFESMVPLFQDARIWRAVLEQGRIEALVHFFDAHKGHQISVIDEYGRLWDQCGGAINCECGSRKWCQLKKGHSGEHSMHKPKESK